jgi:ribonuclease HI
MKPTRSCELYIDGASRGNPGPSGVGVVLKDGASAPVRQLSKYVGETTNNVAEYLALLYALQEALQQGYAVVRVKTDSELLARQINGQYTVRNPQLRLLHGLAVHLLQGFRECVIEHIPRTQNALADRLAGQAVKTRSRTDL